MPQTGQEVLECFEVQMICVGDTDNPQPGLGDGEEGEWVRASACAGGRSVTTLVCPGPPGRQAKVDWVHGARLECEVGVAGHRHLLHVLHHLLVPLGLPARTFGVDSNRGDERECARGGGRACSASLAM